MHIDTRNLEIVHKILKFYAPKYEIWAFGSRVTGKNLKEFSDLDLAVISDKPLDTSVLFELKDAFSNSNLPFRVDVVDWASTSDNFRKIIQQNYEVLQKAAQ